MSDELITYQIYSPASVLGIFNNALRLPQTISLIYLKGRYTAGHGKAYGGYYYDLLYSESDSTSIGIRISSLLRTKLVNAEVYTLKGFIEKNIKNSSIELRFVVEEIIQQEVKQISEEDLQRFEIIQKKLAKGSRDLETFIREKILKNEPIRIANVYGNSAVVQRDFTEGLDVSSGQFEITDFSCNITSSTSITEKVIEIENLEFDILALVRGGGDRQSFEAFNDIKLAEHFLSLTSLTITAIGHTVDETLLDKIADKKFHLPHDYGASLHAVINKLSEEKSNSRAILIDEVKKDITKQFDEQVKTLQTQLIKKNNEFVEAQKNFKENVEKQNKTFNDQLKIRNDEVEKLKKDLTQKHTEQVKTLQGQLNKKNQEFVEVQKTFKEHMEQQNKTFNEQLKVRNDEVEKLKKDLTQKHTQQVATMENQLKKKNEEFAEVQKTFKEHMEEQNKTFNEQLKVRSEEIEKLKKDFSEKHTQQIKTVQDQLTNKNEEFQKLQESSINQLEDLHKNFQKQQKERQEEMENYKREIGALHEKNIQSEVKSKTAHLNVEVMRYKEESAKLHSDLESKTLSIGKIVFILLVGLVLGYILFRFLL